MCKQDVSQARKPPSRWWTIIIGCGLALSPIHNRWLTDLATNSKGETLFFLPAFGYLMWVMGTGLFLLYHWDRVKEVGWGDKRLIGPLLFIVVAVALSGASAEGWVARFAPLGMGIALFGLYLVGRTVGKDLFIPLAVGAGVASLGVIIAGILQLGMITGGLVFEWNYDIVVGYVLLGVALLYGRWRLPLISLALVAMFLSGSPEAVFVVSVVGIIVLSRRDWSRRLVLTLVPVVVVAVVWFGLGYGQHLYSYSLDIMQGEPSIPPTVGNMPPVETDDTPAATLPKLPEYNVFEYRLIVIKEALTSLSPLGEGYNLTDLSKSPNIHNVPLVIVQQLGWPGVLAGICWLGVSVWCLFRTKWKYVWVLILALSVFDHYMWTQLGYWWWVAVGASTAQKTTGTDLLFRKQLIEGS